VAPKNYIVQRHSPDWLTFDIESSRIFLRGLGLEESIVVDFAAIWDRSFAVDYRNFRQRIQDISTRNYASVAGGSVLDLAAFERRRGGEGDLAIFVDDDDWLHRDVFDLVRSAASRDGASWGSIIIGGEFNPQSINSANRQIEIRAISSRLYTNNYAVGRSAIDRLGLLPLLEHHQAQLTLQEGRFRPSIVRRYLSATNKHPCSTLSARRHLESTEFLANPRGVIASQRDALAGSAFTHDTQWTAPMVADLLALLDDALRRPPA
jgi:hypothetical protein